MNCSQAKRIKIKDFLESIRIFPDKTRRSGTVLLYRSPYRNEKNPSFEVNSTKNYWFDHATGRGGNILDLVMVMQQTDIKGSLRFLESKTNSFSFCQQEKNTIQDLAENKTEIIKIQPIEYPGLLSYLKERAISKKIANQYLKEIIYKNWSVESNSYKTYRSLGFENDRSGYELRNKYFKNCTSKFYSTIPGVYHSQLNIFEGFFDFLSALEIKNSKKLKYDSLVLNSTAMREKTIQLIQKYAIINLFLDNDQAGRETVDFYSSHHLYVKNFAGILYPYSCKDLNEYLILCKKH